MSRLSYMIISNAQADLIPTCSMDFVAWMSAMRIVWKKLDERRANAQ